MAWQEVFWAQSTPEDWQIEFAARLPDQRKSCRVRERGEREKKPEKSLQTSKAAKARPNKQTSQTSRCSKLVITIIIIIIIIILFAYTLSALLFSAGLFNACEIHSILCSALLTFQLFKQHGFVYAIFFSALIACCMHVHCF